MKKGMLLVSVFSFLMLGTVAAVDKRPIDVVKLQAAMTFPEFNPLLRFEPNPCGFVFMSDGPERLEEIEALEAAMNGDSSDAERYNRLASLYDDPDLAQKAADRAVRLYRHQVKLHPNDCVLLAHFGTALQKSGRFAEADRVLRHAVRIAPTEWEPASALAEFLTTKAIALLTGSEVCRLSSVEGNEEWPELDKKASPKRRKEGEDLGKEAEAAFDRAVTIAPDKVEPLLRRAAWRSGPAFFRCAGYEDDECFRRLAKSAILDYWRASELEPENPRILEMVATLIVYQNSLYEEKSDPQGDTEIRSDRNIGAAMAKLGKLAVHNDPRIASEACTSLLFVKMIFYEDEDLDPEQDLRLSLKLDPSNLAAWDYLTSWLFEKGNYSDAVTVATEMLKHHDHPYVRLRIAELLAEKGHWKEACEHLDACLRKTPNDPVPHLAKAVLLMKEENSGRNLQQAGYEIRCGMALLNEKSDEDLKTEFQCIKAIHLALSGDVDKAQRAAHRVLAKEPKHTQAEKILAAIGAS